MHCFTTQLHFSIDHTLGFHASDKVQRRGIVRGKLVLTIGTQGEACALLLVGILIKTKRFTTLEISVAPTQEATTFRYYALANRHYLFGAYVT